MIRQILPLLLLSFATCLGLSAQQGIVVGLSSGHIVKVNLETAELTPLVAIIEPPVGAAFSGLVYVPRDTAFYTLLQDGTQPTLVKLRITGTWERVGTIALDGQPAAFAKALTYDDRSNRLFIAAHVHSTGTNAESLLVIDRATAQCRPLATIRQDAIPNDFDKLAVFNGQLFCMDISPERNTTYIFPFDMSALSGELFAGTKQNIPVFTIDDVVVMGQVMYFPDLGSQTLHAYDFMARKWRQVARLHSTATELSSIRLTGLAFLPLEQA